jgi:hypothetical protein
MITAGYTQIAVGYKLVFKICSVPEPYRSPDWALVPAKTGPKAEY